MSKSKEAEYGIRCALRGKENVVINAASDIHSLVFENEDKSLSVSSNCAKNEGTRNTWYGEVNVYPLSPGLVVEIKADISSTLSKYKMGVMVSEYRMKHSLDK